MSKEKRTIFDIQIEGIYFNDEINSSGSEIYHFSSVVNPKGILMSLLDDEGKFNGEMLLNPGETEETFRIEKCEECHQRKIIFGLTDKYDKEGNITIEYFTGFIDETKTIIIIRSGEDFKAIKRFINPGETKEIKVGIR